MCARANRPAMGVATATSHKNKAVYRQLLDAFEGDSIQGAIADVFRSDAQINASHPINEAGIGSGYYDDVIAPIKEAFEGCTRQNYIVLGGEYLGAEWVTSTGYFYGHFAKSLQGIPPSGKLAFLRFGEFHRMEDGKIVESHVYLGFAELIIALGLWPLAPSQGYEGVIPGPATQDGVWDAPSDPETSRASADLVEGMLKNLASPEQAWRSDWHDRMVWYGPGGLGSYSTLKGFSEFQRPFEETFDGWGEGAEAGHEGVGSNCKSGDGDYAFLHGWRQLTGVQVKPFLGLPATNKRVYMRDCDWWRCKDGKIIENWCMLDIPHVLMQLGYDLFAEVARTDKHTAKEAS